MEFSAIETRRIGTNGRSLLSFRCGTGREEGIMFGIFYKMVFRLHWKSFIDRGNAVLVAVFATMQYSIRKRLLLPPRRRRRGGRCGRRCRRTVACTEQQASWILVQVDHGTADIAKRAPA